MQNGPRKIRFNDLTGLGPWFEKHNIPVELQREDSGRVVGEVEATDEAYRLMAEYQGNPSVNLLDFLAVQRRLRGRLLDVRDGNGRNGRRDRETGNGRNI